MQNMREWTETDLHSLIGQQENYQLEFKSAKLLTLNSSTEIAAELSQVVSAFANSAGGTVIIGIEERSTGKRKAKEAASIDGVPIGHMQPSTLQQIITSNVSPLLLGVRVRPVTLTGPNGGKLAFVIHVPAGSTAYQASDKHYYGRLEYENRALPDHEIRMRMMRAKTPILELDVPDIRWISVNILKLQLSERRAEVDEELDAAYEQQRLAYEALRFPDYASDAAIEKALDRLHEVNSEIDALDNYMGNLEFETIVRNRGEATAHDFLLHLMLDSDYEVMLPKGGQCLSAKSTAWSSQTKFYPGWEAPFPHDKWTVKVPRTHTSGTAVRIMLYWKMYVDDAPSVAGEFDVGAIWKDYDVDSLISSGAVEVAHAPVGQGRQR